MYLAPTELWKSIHRKKSDSLFDTLKFKEINRALKEFRNEFIVFLFCSIILETLISDRKALQYRDDSIMCINFKEYIEIKDYKRITHVTEWGERISFDSYLGTLPKNSFETEEKIASSAQKSH